MERRGSTASISELTETRIVINNVIGILKDRLKHHGLEDRLPEPLIQDGVFGPVALLALKLLTRGPTSPNDHRELAGALSEAGVKITGVDGSYMEVLFCTALLGASPEVGQED